MKVSFSAVCCLTLLAITASVAWAKPGEILYTSSNDAGNNQILLFREASDGSLELKKTVSTGGRGDPAILGLTQGAITMTRNRHWLFVINAGSNEISVFEAEADDLELSSRVNSRGTTPVSIAVNRDLVYVLHSGSNNITGFRLNQSNGQLTPIPNSTRALSCQGTIPIQISYSPDGRFLVVTESNTSKIDTFAVNYATGLVSSAIVNASSGGTPFSFAFDPWGHMIVSELNFIGQNRGSASSYNLNQSGTLSPISPVVANNQTGSCWVVITKNGKYAYVSNPLSFSLTGYRLNTNGQLQLLVPSGVSAATGPNSFPFDLGLSRDGEDLYVLNGGVVGGGTNSITSFIVNEDGSLTPKPGAAPIPLGATGILVR